MYINELLYVYVHTHTCVYIVLYANQCRYEDVQCTLYIVYVYNIYVSY